MYGCHKNNHNQILKYICLEKKCRQNILGCLKCLKEDHDKHSFVTIEELEKQSRPTKMILEEINKRL